MAVTTTINTIGNMIPRSLPVELFLPVVFPKRNLVQWSSIFYLKVYMKLDRKMRVTLTIVSAIVINILCI